MGRFLHVLIAGLARLLRCWADALAAFARPGGGPAGRLPMPAFVSGSSSAPPADWVRRASPPPPAHWLAVVRGRAPGFLKPDSGTLEVPSGEQPGVPFEGKHRRLLAPKVAPRIPAPLRGELGSAPTTSSRVPSGPARAPGKRWVLPRRVVTIIEEKPRRTSADPATRVVASIEPEGPPVAAEKRLFRNEPPPVPSEPPMPRRTEPATVPVEQSPLFRLAAEERSWNSRRVGEAAAVESESSRRDVSRWAEFPDRRLQAFRPDADGVSPSRPERTSGMPGESRLPESPWPELLAPVQLDDPDDARLLLRELRHRDQLDDEQRGTPWSA